MKQKLLSILSCMLVALGLQAQTATLSFANKAQRTEQTTSKQVWEQNGVTLTNNKGKSTSNVADYANPARFYKSSEIVVEYGLPIEKIVFDCNSNDYAKALNSSITSGTVSVSSKQVTVTLSEPATKYTIASLTGGQVRMNSLTVYYVEETGGEEEPTAPVKPELTASCKFLDKQEVVISCSTKDATIYYTTDGTTPTAESTVYSEPITVTETTTVKAFAKNEVGESEVVEATYTKAEYQNIAGVIADGEQNVAITSGTVVATYAKGFLFGDETGYILTYMGKESGLTVGDVVNVSGATSTYAGFLQLTNASIETTGTAEVSLPDPEVLDGAAMDELVATPVIKYVQYTGTLKISDKKYYNVIVEGAEKAQGSIQYPNAGLGVDSYDGKEIIVTGFVIGVSSSKYLNTMAVSVELGNTTGVKAIASENAAPVVYDLLGRRVENLTSGIYIVNGKKVVIK